MGKESFLPCSESQPEHKTVSPDGSPVSHLGGLRNKPLSPALCHMLTKFLFTKISQQNQSVLRLLSKPILYFLHLCIHI